jgi:hypothetical protein
MRRLQRHVRFVPKGDIRGDANEKERPPCGGLSKLCHAFTQF